MQKHVKNYLKYHGYTETDFIPCAVCGQKAIDIHHVEPRSHFGGKRKDACDSAENLIALCRKHHEEAHGPNSRAIKEDFKLRIKQLKK